MGKNGIPPDTLLGGKIRLIKRIGRGGMGEVWVARNEATQAEVAVKTIHRAERTPEHDERFRREARLSATISHRNVVRVFDLVDEVDGTLGLMMELLRGATLEELMKQRGPLSPLHAVAIAVPVLSAMHHVHKKGIVHRDMKPANVFFAVEPDGHVIPKVLDFGIAKLPSAASALTIDGSVLGTPHYMSPEQIRGQEDIDGRSDMFSFAVVLFEMLTGERVFRRDLAAASLAAVLEHEVDPDPRIPPRLWVELSRALAKRPYERHGSCAELADALRASVDATEDDLARALQELRPRIDAPEPSATSPSSVGASDESPRVPVRRLGGSATVKAAAAAVVIAAALAVGVSLTRPRAEASAPESPPPSASARAPAAPKDSPSPQPIATATAVDVAIEPPALEPAPAAPAADGQRKPPPRRPPPGDKGSSKRARGSSGGVATTPGF